MSSGRKSIAGFTIDVGDISYFGEGLSRPESVWVDAEGIWTSDNRGGVAMVVPGAAPLLLGSGISETNGIWRCPDKSFLAAGLGDQRLHRIDRDGTTTVVLDAIEARPLGAVNSVCRDGQGTTWISVMTARAHWYEALNAAPDGYIIRLDSNGAAVAAEGLHLTNEVKIDPTGQFLYAAESLGRRIVRFAILQDGSLGPRESVGPDDLGRGALPDGFAFDADGNVWITLINRNAIAVISTSGDLHIVFEEVNGPALDVAVRNLEEGRAAVEDLAACAGKVLALPTSLAFGGPDGRTVYVGSLGLKSLATFRSPIAGAAPARVAGRIAAR
jgi:sugar lactone lactonase YvrE